MAVVNEAVADVAEQVATEALEVADVARVFDTRTFGLGLLAGGAIGAVVAGFVVERRLRTKYEQLAEEEITQMREHFHAKAVALEEKPALDGLVKDLGYVPVVQEGPQTAPVADPGAPNVTVESESESKNVFDEAKERLQEIDPDEGWDYDIERANRSHKVPYVIHRDEQGETPGYTEATFTYYEGDDVLCDARDKIIDARDEVLGSDFQDKFGHGSGDPNVVYIRNDELGCVIEVCRSPNSYAEEVHGFKHSDEPPRRAPRRMTLDDE
jgi:hypothetical protein